MTRRTGLLLAVASVLAGALALRWLYPLDYAAAITGSARARGLDPHLVAAVIRVESGFRPFSRSAKGARGLMQVMPQTGAWAATRMDLPGFHPDDLYDPRTNIVVGTWYLSDLLRTFEGDLVLALTAYNAGRGNVARWLRRRRIPEGADALRIDAVPFPETRRFVRRVLRDRRVYRWLYPGL